MPKAIPAWKVNLRSRLAKLCDKHGRVSEALAVELIKESVWWETHPSGSIQAPGFAKHIYENSGEWKITFGANTFLISRAVHGCCKVIENWLPRQSGPIAQLPWATLQTELASVLRGSVSNFIGEIYQRYTGGSNEQIVFGSHAISIPGFIEVLARSLHSPELGAFSKTSQPRARQSGADAASTASEYTSCPLCGHSVKTVNLTKHQRRKCPRRPAASPQATIVTEEARTTPGGLVWPLGKDETLCQQCGVRIGMARLAEHLAQRCPKRPL